MLYAEAQNAGAPLDAGWRERVLLALGFAGLITFSRMFSLGFVGYLDSGVLVSADQHYLARTIATVASLALLALAGLKQWASVNGGTLASSTITIMAATVVFALDSADTFGFIASVAGGVGNAVLLFAWMLLFSRYRVKRIIEATLLGLAVSGSAIAGAPVLGGALSFDIAFLAAFAAGASAFALDPKMTSFAADGPLSNAQRMRVPWLTVVLMLACSILSGMLYGVAGRLTWLYDWSPNLYLMAIAGALTIGGTVAVMLRSHAWIHVAWTPMFALFAIALVFACFPTRGPLQVAVELTMAAVFCANFLPWLVFPSAFSTLKTPRAFLAGVVLVGTNSSLASLAGDAFGSMLPPSMQNLSSVSGVFAITLAVLFATTFVMFRHSVGAVGAWTAAETRRAAENAGASDPAPADNDDAPSPAEQANPLDALRERVDALVGEYGLTPRESEVAFLTIQGFSCAYIAEKLVVSNSTVRFHQQNIYRKADVHSRNELIELVSA